MQCDHHGAKVEVGEGTCLCSQCGHEFTTIKNVILCPGTKEDRSPCKTEIQENSKFCEKCGTEVDPQWFLNIVITRQGQGTYGSACGNVLDKADEFCTEFGIPRPSAVTDSVDKNEIKFQSEETCVKEQGGVINVPGMTRVDKTREDNPVSKEGEDGKQKNLNERGDKINEHDRTSSIIVSEANVAALQTEQQRKVTEKTDNLQNTGEDSADEIENVNEGTKQKVDDSLVVSNREDCRKKETNYNIKKNETYKAEKQEKKNNYGNVVNTYYGRQISNRGDPNGLIFHFHVLVSPDFKLNLDKQNVCIRIISDDLGGSTSQIYQMNHVRQVQKYSEMQISLIMKRQMVFERGFYFKYGIHKIKKNRIKWENYCISDWGESESTRFCRLSKTWIANSEFHLYDGIMNPDIGKWEYFKNTFNGNIVKKLEEDAKMSAEIFTEKLLAAGNIAPMLDPETRNMLEMLLSGLKKRYLHDVKCWSSEMEFKEVMGNTMLSRILKSLESEAETPLSGYTETQQQAERRMQLALFVLSVIGHFKFLLSPHNKSLLARSLLLRPDHQTGALYDLELVLQKPREEKRKLKDYIIEFCNSFQMNDKDPSWLCCIPLLHLLSGNVKPCQFPTDDISHDAQEPYWWGIQSVKSAAEKFKQCSKTWMITQQDIVRCLSPLFELDYFLPRTLMSVLQLKDVEMVIKTKTVPPEVCIATCIYYIKEKSSWNLLYNLTTEDKFQQIISAVGMLKEFLAKFEEPRWSDSLLHRHAYLTRRIAEDMVKITFNKRPQYDLVRDVVQVFLEAVALYDTTQKKLQLHESKTYRNQMVLDAHTKVKTWLSQKFTNFSSTEFTDNLMKWHGMLCSRTFRSSVVADMWNAFIVDDFKKQLEYEMRNGIACKTTLVQQYCSLVESLHPCMQSCLGDLALEAIDSGYNVTFTGLRDEEMVHFGRLLSNLFEKNWNDMVEKNGQKEKKILQFALTWSPYAHYKTLSAGKKRIYNFLSPECSVHLDLSWVILESLTNALQVGKIALEDLQFIHSAEQKFMELTQSSLQTGSDGKSKSDINIGKVIRFRNKEVECYHAQAEKIKILLKLCEYVPTVDSSSISKRMKALLGNRELCVEDICKPVLIDDVERLQLDEYQPQITAFELPRPVFAILDELESCHKSKLFLHFWKDVQNSQITSLEELVTVWKSVKQDWSKICAEIAQGEITFKKFKENLGNMFREDYICMEEEMRLMHIDHNVALTRITEFKQNMQLKACVDGAEVTQRFAENFELVGDFENIKLIACQKEFGQTKMKDFNKNLFETNKFLMELNKERINCLESVIKSKDVVLWLKGSMKGGLKELKVFVDLASISAGEGDREIAKVQCLHAATTGFAPLIFDLRKEFGYKELQERCRIVWKELDTDPSLPEKLVSINSELEWLKTVKQTHGSVEVTSLSQAAVINEEGIYRVGKLKRVAVTEQDLDLHTTVQLVIPREEAKKEYTFQQLQDLQSRLMLVAGKAEQGKDNVDRFSTIFDSVIRVASVYIKLISAGCIMFRNWQAKFLCGSNHKAPVCVVIQFAEGTKPLKCCLSATEDITTIIHNIAKFMEKCLKKWMNYISEKRNTYLELNHYSTAQLIILQQELVKTGLIQGPDKWVFPLLSAVKENCSYDDLVDAMQKASMEIQKEVDKRKVVTIKEEEETKADEKLNEEKSSLVQGPENQVEVDNAELVDKVEAVSIKEEDEIKADGNMNEEKSSLVQSPDNHIFLLLSQAEVDNAVVVPMMEAVETKADEEVNEDGKRDLFIKEMEKNGFSQLVAQEASKHINPDEIEEGLLWCMDNQERVENGEFDVEDNEYDQTESQNDGNKVDPPGATQYQAWNRSDESVKAVTTVLDKLELDRDMSVGNLVEDLKHLWKEFLNSVSSSAEDCLSVEHLGLILRRLAEKAEVLHTLLTIYMIGKDEPLPQADEVLMCTSQTTVDELDVFWRRSLGNRSSRIHCLVNADVLSFEAIDKGEVLLENYMKQINNEVYRLIVICSSDNENRSKIVAALDKYRRQLDPLPNEKIASYIQEKLHVDVDVIKTKCRPAALVDPDRSCVRIVKSWRSGVGKSLYVKRSIENLAAQNQLPKQCYATLRLQERDINISEVTQTLLGYTCSHEEASSWIFHLDISHEVQEGVDSFLFNLLILGCLTHKSGYVWRRSLQDLYLVETMPIMERDQTLEGKGLQHAHFVYEFLPYIICRSPLETMDILTDKEKPQDFRPTDQLFDDGEFRSSTFQRPYQYLMNLDQEEPEREMHSVLGLEFLMRHGIDVYQSKRRTVDPSTPQGTQTECLSVLLRHCGVPDPSWAEIHHFVLFLDTQLRDFEQSDFCKDEVVRDLPGFSDFVLRFLIQMSRDFSTRSLNMSEESSLKSDEDEERMQKVEDIAQYQWRRTWESSPHPYLFFNPDHHSLTFVGFNIDEHTRNLVDLQTGKVLEKTIMSRYLYRCLEENRVPIKEKFDTLPRGSKIERLCLVMGNEMPHDPDDTYELTTDNVKKILAIYMRFRCNIPVIIMGETGCGKTRLVKFLCALQNPAGVDVKNMILLKVHGGTTNADIKRKVQEAEKLAQENSKKYPNMFTVLFFDEANTTESIGLIKEILCDKSIEGRPLQNCQDLKMVAACNPYRKHSEDLIKHLEQAGLGYHVEADKTTDRLGRVPMRRLVYRVQPLPQSLLPLVWDFGQLNTQIEDLYIVQMVKRYIIDKRLPNIPGIMQVISGILTASQDFMRQQKDECSFVSLRDVDRVLNVMSWFYTQSQGDRTLFNMMDQYTEKEDETSDEEIEKEQPPCTNQNRSIDDITRSLILALGACYHACLKKRKEYRQHVIQYFKPPLKVPDGQEEIEAEITRCQDVFLNNVKLEKNIARNTALKENMFMMVICIELRIPLFLVGKPGSSKSLAKTIVADAMHGNGSQKDLFKKFKQVQMVSFQCSPLSTPDGIVGTFRQCAQFQKNKDLVRFVSVVVLDEVGLAEDSPKMPLKTLHPLLEDGCQGDEEPEQHKKVAFIGISNWALDPAKMNRGILVQRDVPDLLELGNSAEGICSSDPKTRTLLKPLIRPLAEAYLELFGKASEELREFYGLRDFYSLIKMIYSFCEKSKNLPTWYQLLHAIKRNFGGLENVNVEEIFTERLKPLVKIDSEPQDGDPDCTPKGLIHASLFDAFGLQRESRYLLLLIENYGALTILQQQMLNLQDPEIIFGSSFPSDQEYTQVCRNINSIKVCMETGKTVVLLNLENLYESLYDALNQYYVYFGGDSYVDLGLGTHRVKCKVHKNFRLIVVAEKDVVYKKFPIPLINRLEKHLLTINTMLTKKQQDLANTLKKWAEDFATETAVGSKSQRQRTVGDVFIGYHIDTCSTIVLFVWEDLHKKNKELSEEKILEESKKVLLWSVTPEAVVRLERCLLPHQEAEFIRKTYWEEQNHDNLSQYLQQRLQSSGVINRACFMQVTTHSKLLSLSDKKLKDISKAINIPRRRIALEALQSFDTEQHFSRKIRSFFDLDPEEESVLIVQCDSGDINANLVACARYCIQDEHQKVMDRRTVPCHVVFIIQLPRIAGGCFTGLQCGLWHSVHIDDIRAQDSDLPSLDSMMGISVGRLLEMAILSQTSADNAVETQIIDASNALPSKDSASDDQGKQQSGLQKDNRKLNVYSLIMSSVQSALAMVKDREETSVRATERISLVLHLLRKTSTDKVPSFLQGVSIHLVDLLKQKEARSGHEPVNWLSNEVSRPENINKAGTFRHACIQYLESRVSQILAGIIAHVDTNQNLDILCNHIKSWDWLAELWLHIFNTPAATQLQYFDLWPPHKQQELNEVIVKTTGCEGHTFQGELPFSWLIFEQIDGICRTTHENFKQEGEDVSPITSIVHVFKETPLGKLLDGFQGHLITILQLYTQDFVNMTIKVHSDAEREHISRAILHVARTLCPQEDASLGLVSIHEGYRCIAQHLAYFRSISQVWPECSETLREFHKQNPQHDLINQALDVQGLTLLLEQFSTQDSSVFSSLEGQARWMEKVNCLRPVVEKCLAFYNENRDLYSSPLVLSARHIWTRVMVMKLFIEHVSTMGTETDRCKLLWKMCEKVKDLKQIESFQEIEKFLKMLNQKAAKEVNAKLPKCPGCEGLIEDSPVTLPCKHVICYKCYVSSKAMDNKCPGCLSSIPADFEPDKMVMKRDEVQRFKYYQHCCNNFFMDVVSQLCFMDNTLPSEKVVDKLLGYITMTISKKEGAILHVTKELTVFNDCVDPNPVFRSFLLQLLLRTRKDTVKENLEKYLNQAEKVMAANEKEYKKFFTQLCYLVVQCLEDKLHREVAGMTEDADFARNHLDNAKQLLQQVELTQTLYGIAFSRFGLSVTAKYVHQAVVNKTTKLTQSICALFDSAAALCVEQSSWPKTFFIKYLCRCYGMYSYLAICQETEISSLKGLCMEDSSEAEISEVSDRYIACGSDYTKIRNAVSQVAKELATEKLEQAVKELKALNQQKEVLIGLALHREITMSYLQANQSETTYTQKVIDAIQKYCTEARYIRNKQLLQAIIQNKCGRNALFLTVTPDLDSRQQGLLCLLIHCDLVLRNLNGDRTLMQPLIRLATQPQTLQDPFLPTMPDDDLANIRKAILTAGQHRQEQFPIDERYPFMAQFPFEDFPPQRPVIYRCPNRHPYVIGDCGRPNEISVCRECGAQIGGMRHVLLPGNTTDDEQDMTETGHILGATSGRAPGAIPERDMSPAYCAVVRLILHLTMILGANHHPKAICGLIKPKIAKKMVAQFLLEHIQHDLNDLHQTLGRSTDDVLVMMHYIFNLFMQKQNKKEQLGDELCSLRTKDSRHEWEREFTRRYLNPVLQDLENILQKINQDLAKDKRTDSLHCIVYEMDTPQVTIPASILQEDPSMWRYRTQITIDHLHREFEVQMTSKQENKTEHKVLQLFLREEHHLRAIRCIPSIHKLYQILFQKYQHRLSHADASSITVGSLLESDRKGQLETLIKDYSEAWKLTRISLSRTMQVMQKYCENEINQDTPVSQLLPSSSGAGLCAWSLMRFLLKKQNDFLEEYCRVQQKSTESLPKVKVKDITAAHLISYHPEQDILPLILANCNYSYEVGKGTTIEYNFTNLERQIMDRFIFGKSWIDIEIQEMVYRANRTNTAVFRQLDDKIPQEPLSNEVQYKIREEFGSLPSQCRQPDLCQALDNLDIALSFLKSIGGNPDYNLHKFMINTLQMEQSLYSATAKQLCKYKHIRSLWLLLSLEKTKLQADQKQVIFDGVPESYHLPLTPDLKKSIEDYLQPLSVKCLAPLLELMFECIVLVITVQQNPEDYVDIKEEKFGDYLQGLLYGRESEINILEKFPEVLLSKYCVSTWELTYTTIKRKEQSEHK